MRIRPSIIAIGAYAYCGTMHPRISVPKTARSRPLFAPRGQPKIPSHVHEAFIDRVTSPSHALTHSFKRVEPMKSARIHPTEPVLDGLEVLRDLPCDGIVLRHLGAASRANEHNLQVRLKPPRRDVVLLSARRTSDGLPIIPHKLIPSLACTVRRETRFMATLAAGRPATKSRRDGKSNAFIGSLGRGAAA